MNVLVTAGPTREYIDDVRFITNASSGRMGYAVAGAAVDVGHQVTLLSGPVCLDAPGGCDLVTFVTVAELKTALEGRFDACDVLIMTAAVGDFRPKRTWSTKLSRRAGPVDVRLVPTEDIVASIASRKRAGQRVVTFAVEDGPEEAIVDKARAEMAEKNADYVVVNTPAAMGSDCSRACILTPEGTALGWSVRSKTELAGILMGLLGPQRKR